MILSGWPGIEQEMLSRIASEDREDFEARERRQESWPKKETICGSQN